MRRVVSLLLCEWKPPMAERASVERLRELGVKPGGGKAEYTVSRQDVHPEQWWDRDRVEGRSKGRRLWYGDDDKLNRYGFLADIYTEAVASGLEKTEFEQAKRKFFKPSETQGGHGVHSSEFVNLESDVRLLQPHTHQFRVLFDRLGPEWEVDVWDGRFQALKRTFTFDNPRYPYFIYNRVNDRVIVQRVHYPIEMLIQGNTCTMWFTTTYVQGVSCLDFETCTFLDKERSLMERPDWTPVVRKKNPSGTRTFEVVIPEGVDLSGIDMGVSPDAFLKQLSGGDWSLSPRSGHAELHVNLRSWYRVMDVVNRMVEFSEAARQYPLQTRIRIGELSLVIDVSTRGGRYVAFEMDALLQEHQHYLASVWGQKVGYARPRLAETREHLADQDPSPRSHFLKNPLGKGKGPIRNVTFDLPKRTSEALCNLAWGKSAPAHPHPAEGGFVLISPSGEMTHSNHEAKTAGPGVLQKLRTQVQADERLKAAPRLE